MGKTLNAKPPKGLNPTRYRRLLGQVLPKVIETEEELGRMAECLEHLTFKEDATPEERAIAALLERLIQDYDDRTDLPDVPPNKVIQYLMDKRSLRQVDLVPVFGSSSVASDVLAGKREPSKAHIRKLAEFFNVSPELFL